jgi:1-aminocyclopropane-1-carboxylate deaminase
MLAGLVNGSSPSQKLIGIAVLKNEPAFESIQKLLNEYTRSFELFYDYHFGGYAKHTPELLQFMNKFYLDSKIPSDFVYTGKLFYAISDLVEKKYFSPGSRLLIIHSGGLQGNQSLSKGTLIF